MEPKPKGILKTTEELSNPPKDPVPVKWDEENITLTLHPPDKDYGHMKIDEPNTPYNYSYATSEDEEMDDLAHERWSPPDQLDASQLQATLESTDWDSRSLKFEEQTKKMSLEEAKYKEEFVSKRSAHYNEFQKMKEMKAAGLLDSDEESDEEEQEETNGMEVEEAVPSSTKRLAAVETKKGRRVSISLDAEKNKDPAKMSEFDKKRKAHYSGEYVRASLVPASGAKSAEKEEKADKEGHLCND